MSIKSTGLAAAAAFAVLVTANAAGAAPALSGAAAAVAEDARASTNLEPVRWVCGPFGRRCVWVSSRSHHVYRPYRPHFYTYSYTPRHHWRPAPRFNRWYW